MKTTTLRNLFLALLMCVGTVAVAQPATIDDTVAAVLVLQQELLAAKTPAAIQAAKAKALAAGVPTNTIESTVSATLPTGLSTKAIATQSQPAVKKSVSTGGSTTGSGNSIPTGGTNIADTGSTYN